MMENQARFLTLVLLCVQCGARVEREQTFNLDDLSSASVTVDILSEIPGLIRWIYTDGQHFSVKLKMYAENDMEINSTGINLRSTNSSVYLMISEEFYPIAPAPVTGTGNVIQIPSYLVWFLALLIGWNNPMAVLLTVLAYGFTLGSADDTYIPRKTMEIEVKAPRRLLYKTINLYINGGKLRVVDWTTEGAVVPTCKTEATSDGCPYCCHGNGVCSKNRCICDNEDDQDPSCASSKRQTIFFSHPFDPRYERTILPNGDVLTLSRAFQYIQEPPYLKDPDTYAMEIRSRHVTFSHVLLLFNADGFIEEIIDLNSSEKSVVKLKRSRLKDCIIRLQGNQINLELNICESHNPFKDTTLNMVQRTSINSQQKESTSQIRKEKENRRRGKRKRKKTKPQFDFNFIEFPVRIERCGYYSPDSNFVYFQLFEEQNGAIHGTHPNIRRQLSIIVSENITLLSHDYNDGTLALRIPDNTVPLEINEKKAKCKVTKSLQRKICSSNVETLRTVCDTISNHTDTKQSTPSHFFRIVELCTFVLGTVLNYCDKADYTVLSEDVPCLSTYFDSFNLFSNGTYIIRPIALYPDDKIITGKERKVNFSDHRGVEGNEFTIIDKEANFKIVQISVIPKDPVPHDIYQVKLDHACATSETVIKMTVYGSDFYSNDVICHGITSCNCCILHAAGAPNAVVDHVTINVTDFSRNYSHVREMVVVF